MQEGTDYSRSGGKGSNNGGGPISTSTLWNSMAFGFGDTKQLEIKSKKVELQENFIPKSSIRQSICYNKLDSIQLDLLDYQIVSKPC